MTGPQDTGGHDEDATQPSDTEATDSAATAAPAAEPDTDGAAATDAVAPDDQARRPPASAAAAAASRARRIGGRSVVARPADPSEPTTSTSTTSTSSATTSSATPAAAAPAGDTDRAAARTKRTRGRATGTVGLTKSSDDDSGKTGKSTKRGRSGKSGKAGAGTARSSRDANPGLRWVPAVVLTVAALVLAVVVAVSTHGERWGRPSGGTVRDQVLAAAKSCLVSTNTYKYNALDTYEKKGLACAGGTFATQFRSTVDKVLRKNAPAVKQQQSLQVNTAGLIDVTDNNQWDVLVYGQISVTNTTQTTARVDPFGAVAHLKKIDGHWRVTQLCSQSVGGSADTCY